MRKRGRPSKGKKWKYGKYRMMPVSSSIYDLLFEVKKRDGYGSARDVLDNVEEELRKLLGMEQK